MHGYSALFGVALFAAMHPPANGTCLQVTDISLLCSAFSSQTCAVWAGKGTMMKLPSACTATKDFELQCEADAAVLSCPAGDCFTVATSSVNNNVTLKITSCTIFGAFVVSGELESGYTRALVLETVHVEGTLEVRTVPVALHDVSILKTTSLSSALLLNGIQATATTLTIRCDPSYSPSLGGGIYLSNTQFSAEVVDIENCSSTLYGGAMFATASTVTITEKLDARNAVAPGGGACIHI
ncbi:hypothetical protein DIPPA_65626, partial [Diplonema papillatum]